MLIIYSQVKTDQNGRTGFIETKGALDKFLAIKYIKRTKDFKIPVIVGCCK